MGPRIRTSAIAVAFTLLGTAFLQADNVPWQGDLERALQSAASSGKPVLVHFYSSNCPPCKLLDVRAFNDPSLVETMRSETIPVKINVDHHREAADRYQVTRWPTDVYLFPDGSELYRTVSPQDPKVYAQMIQRASLRNRDWVLEKNSTFAVAQRRQANSQDSEQPNVRDQMVRTPSRELAPGQVSPPRVQAQLANYPVQQSEQVVDPRFDAKVPSPPQPPIAATPQGNRYQGLSGMNNVGKPAVVPAVLGPHNAPEVSKAMDGNNLPQIVQGNRYKSYSQHFSNANTQTVGRSTNKSPSPTVVPNPSVMPGYAAPSESPVQSATLDNPNPGLSGIAISDPKPVFEAPIVQPQPSPSNGFQAPQFDSPPMVSPNISAMTVAAPANSESASKPDVQQPTKPSPSIVFDGNCPVALERTFEWKPGSAKFGVKHRGRIYYCESEESRTIFLSDPDRYSPEFSGYDVVKFLESGELVEGDRRFGCSFQDRIYLFSNNDTYQRFLEAREAISAELKQVQSAADKVAHRPESNGTLQR